jgi:hypothetical protein
MYDIKDIYEAVQKLNTKKQRIMKKARGKRTFDVTNEWTVPISSFIEGHHIVIDHVTWELRGSVVADVEIPDFQFNPFQTAWELIPYSFVLDWFLSVGKSISAASFLTLQSDYQASWGFKVSIERSYRYDSIALENCDADWWQEASCIGSYERRTPCSVPLTPHFTLRLNPYKILDLLGMIIQRSGR